ncbi:MAG TPA: isopentenyl phosphate kinase [Thermoplasmata archaeon]|nr:isopentenyl phosphate kinase [Thermoplasmata archaeon]
MADPLPPDRPRPVIVKLGGSVLTRKRDVERVRPKIVRRLAQEIASVQHVPIILLHGAGSFGHPSAARWHLAEAPAQGDPPHHRLRGAAIVGFEVRRLHAKLMAELLEAGANPISVPLSGHATNRLGRLAELEATPVSQALRSGGLPVSFGDVVPDSEWGFSILSADTIAVELARRLNPSRVVFASDVPGVLEPGSTGRRIAIRSIDEAVLGRLSPTPGVADVTGGIRAKVEAMLAIARLDVDAGLISGLSDGALVRAIQGEPVYGSWARAGSRQAGAPDDGAG